MQPTGSKKPAPLNFNPMKLESQDSSSGARRRLHAEVHGRVQGVGFRAFVLNRAIALRLTGTVRNVYFPRQYVDVIAEGPEPALKTLLGYLHQGPQLSRVERVDTIWSQPLGDYSSFRII